MEKMEYLDLYRQMVVIRRVEEKAAELYQQLLDMTPASNTERPIFELRLGEAQALAALGGGTTNAAVPPTAPQQVPGQTAPAPKAPVLPVPEPTTTGN